MMDLQSGRDSDANLSDSNVASVSPDKEEVRNFLVTLQLSEFWDMFQYAGVHEMATLCELTDEELKSLGLGVGYVAKLRLALRPVRAQHVGNDSDDPISDREKKVAEAEKALDEERKALKREKEAFENEKALAAMEKADQLAIETDLERQREAIRCKAEEQEEAERQLVAREDRLKAEMAVFEQVKGFKGKGYTGHMGAMVGKGKGPCSLVHPAPLLAGAEEQLPPTAAGQPIGPPRTSPRQWLAQGSRTPLIPVAAFDLAPPSVQKQMLGEKLYPAIARYAPEVAGKITGMFLEMDNSELLMLLESEAMLQQKVDEALFVLGRSYWSNSMRGA